MCLEEECQQDMGRHLNSLPQIRSGHQQQQINELIKHGSNLKNIIINLVVGFNILKIVTINYLLVTLHIQKWTIP